MRPAGLAILGLCGSLAGALGCGRSTLFECAIGVAPSALDFGTVPAGTTVSRSLMVSSLLNNGCDLSSIAVATGGDPGFTPSQTRLGIEAGTELPITVTFTPGSGTAHAAATLVLESDDPAVPSVSIPLTAKVVACYLTAPDGGVDFATLTIGETAVQSLTLTNAGLATCNGSAALSQTSDPGFSLPSSRQRSFSLTPGASTTLAVQYEIGEDVAPAIRTGTLAVTSNTPSPTGATQSTLNVPLQAHLPGCNLQASPTVLNFGNIPPDGSATDSITLVNDGGLECDVSGLALAAGTDPDYSLPSQATSFSVPAGGTAQVSVTFVDSNGATPPNSHTGTLDVSNADPSLPTLQIPLQAYVNPACVTSGRYIYVIDASGMLARFDPTTLSITNIGFPNCPELDPFSMAVDQNAIAWAIYVSGNLYRIDTSNASCQTTAFAGDQTFGMSFLFNSATGVDTLYVANDQLGTIAFPSLALTYIAQLGVPQGELAGTGDGQLWDFALGDSTLYQLDPGSGQVLQTVPVATNGSGGGYAMKFWGGSFWIFIGSSVFEVPRSTGVATQVLSNDGYDIVGAGVSDCAPVQ